MDREQEAKIKFLEANKKGQRQVCVGVPSGDDVKANFSMAGMAMSYYCGLAKIPLAFISQKGSMLPKNRNTLVDEAIALNCTHLLQIDSDVTFPPHALARLLFHKKAFVGATYARRSLPHDNLAVPLNREANHHASGLLPVDRLPTGFLLIDLDVLKASNIKKPYFRFPTTEESAAFPHGRIDGEDYYLCDAVRAAGETVWLDVDLSFDLVHWGEAGWRLKQPPENYDGTQPLYEMVELQASKELNRG